MSQVALKDLFTNPQIDIEKIGAELDNLSPENRILAVRQIGKKSQNRLYEEAKKIKAPIDLNFLVPEKVSNGETVIFYGKNSLPCFSHFQKRFCRPSEKSGKIVGYNHQSMAFLTGPGYFQARIKEGELIFDYTDLPTEEPKGWPKLKPNEKGFSRFVYKNMLDICFPLGKFTLIGAAYDIVTTKFKGQTFLLTRGPGK